MPNKSFRLMLFDTFKQAKQQGSEIQAACPGCDQLNVVIREEGDMDDQELLGLDPKVKVFAGAAWTLIHERRRDDGWYPQS